MIDAGKAYNAANKQFVSGIRELAQQSTKDEVIEVNVITFININASRIFYLEEFIEGHQNFTDVKFFCSTHFVAPGYNFLSAFCVFCCLPLPQGWSSATEWF